MAAGDMVGVIANTAGFATLTYQPAAGVEAIITNLGSSLFNAPAINSHPLARVIFTNGVIISFLAHETFNPEAWMKFKVPVSNTNYIGIINSNAVAQDLVIAGVQTK